MASGRDARIFDNIASTRDGSARERALTSNSHLPPWGLVMTRSTLLDPATEPRWGPQSRRRRL